MDVSTDLKLDDTEHLYTKFGGNGHLNSNTSQPKPDIAYTISINFEERYIKNYYLQDFAVFQCSIFSS